MIPFGQLLLIDQDIDYFAEEEVQAELLVLAFEAVLDLGHLRLGELLFIVFAGADAGDELQLGDDRSGEFVHVALAQFV